MTTPIAPLHTWLIEPLPAEMSAAVNRLRRAPDVAHVSIMPDAHLASEVCVGTVFATRHLLYPQAVGGDIGCGMLAIAFDIDADVINDGKIAGRILSEMIRRIPTSRHHRAATIPLPQSLSEHQLSNRMLQTFLKDEGVLQFATLGGGNHFIELQADEADQLWLMIHSGSRAMGQTIRDHHQSRAKRVESGFKVLDATTADGQEYLSDVRWARDYAHNNRIAMAMIVEEILRDTLRTSADHNSMIGVDHNHVEQEAFGTELFWIHRKGAMPAEAGSTGVIPGSMGTESYHVVGRGSEISLRSSAHGAGRRLSREKARQAISEREVLHRMKDIWFDYRKLDSLREESPAAYKDVRAVMRAQSDLVKIIRKLRPVLNYKG